MKVKNKALEVLHTVLRPAFGVVLFLTQFTSRRGSFFSENPILLALGAVFVLAGAALWIWASVHLQRVNGIAMSGPYRAIRHPIYASIYLLSIGLGFLFFAWLWFVALVVFLPLWWLECVSEEKEMLERYGEAYRAYQERTGMFIA